MSRIPPAVKISAVAAVASIGLAIGGTYARNQTQARMAQKYALEQERYTNYDRPAVTSIKPTQSAAGGSPIDSSQPYDLTIEQGIPNRIGQLFRLKKDMVISGVNIKVVKSSACRLTAALYEADAGVLVSTGKKIIASTLDIKAANQPITIPIPWKKIDLKADTPYLLVLEPASPTSRIGIGYANINTDPTGHVVVPDEETGAIEKIYWESRSNFDLVFTFITPTASPSSTPLSPTPSRLLPRN